MYRGTGQLKVQSRHVSDSSTELHEENVYLAPIVRTVLIEVSERVSMNVSLYPVDPALPFRPASTQRMLFPNVFHDHRTRFSHQGCVFSF